MPHRNPILPIPEQNKFYCQQTKSKTDFNILDHNKKHIYEIISKTVVTRSHYRVIRVEDGVAIGSINQGQLASTYTISDETKSVLAEVKIPDSDEIKIEINKHTYLGKPKNRAKLFEFYDDQNRLVMTIDKKLLALSDKYVTSFIEEFPAKIAALLPVILDDFFHSGSGI